MIGDVAYQARLPYNSDLAKIRKFLEDTDTIKMITGESGIAFMSTSKGDECYFLAMIHACDIYRLYVDKEAWPEGGTVRILSTASLVNFLKGKEANAEIQFSVNKDATVLDMAIISGSSTIRSQKVNLLVPDMIYEYPRITQANVVIMVNEFKKFCSSMAKASSEIKIESQSEALRFTAQGQLPLTYGLFKDDEETVVSYIKNVAFIKASKINIGNTKCSNSGLYVQKGMPLKIKIKLSIVDFVIYCKQYEQ
jgi:hypothetical protein